MPAHEAGGGEGTWPCANQPTASEFERILHELSQLESIYELDPNIVSDDPQRKIPCTLSDTVDVYVLQIALSFYSPCEAERNRAFERNIWIPLKNLLVNVANCCLKWPGKAKHVALFNCLSLIRDKVELELLSVALKDIFSDSKYGLSALRCAIKELRDTQELQAQSVMNLVLFRKLAGYYFDEKAIENLCQMAQPVSEGMLSEWKVRLSMLRFIQVAGEYFQLLLPSTLNLAPWDTDISIAKTLSNLRNKLTHLNSDKLGKLKTCKDDIFEQVRTDIASLATALQHMIMGYQNRKVKFGSNTKDLWNYLKATLPEEVTTTQHTCTNTWFEKLNTLLEPPGGGGASDVNYDEIVGELINSERTAADNVKNLKKFFSALNKKTTAGQDLDAALQTMEVSRKDHDERLARLEDIKRVTTHKKTLKDQFMATTPCCGNGNLSKKYEEFVQGIRTACDKTLLDDNEDFMWMSEPTSKVEKVFHKLHKTSIANKADKDKLRRNKIEQLTGMIESLQEIAGIKDMSVELVATVTANEKILCAKAAHIACVAEAMEGQYPDITKQLWELQKKFTDPKDTIENIIREADTVLNSFVNIRNTDELFGLKQKLIITSQDRHYCLIASRYMEENIKKNHRYQPSSKVTEMIITNWDKIKSPTECLQLIMAHQFIVASFYELLKEVSDYPELACFLDSNQVRNHFSHPDPFQEKNLDIRVGPVFGTRKEELVNEVAILSLNVKFILKSLTKILAQ